MKMKKFKRNAVLVTVIAFVCVAVYLNWSYNNKAAETDAAADAAKLEDTAVPTESGGEDALYYTAAPAESSAPETAESMSAATAEYFANARLTRERSRDSALETLRETAENQSAGAETQAQAVEAMAQISDNALKEGEIENVLIAKGFADCMVYIDTEDVSVIVPAQAAGLSESDVARITEVVVNETAMTAEQLKIIEVKP